MGRIETNRSKRELDGELQQSPPSFLSDATEFVERVLVQNPVVEVERQAWIVAVENLIGVVEEVVCREAQLQFSYFIPGIQNEVLEDR